MDILEVLRARLQEILAERSATDEQIEALLGTVASEQRSEMTAEETTQFGELRGQLSVHDTAAGELEQRIAAIEAARASRAQAEERARQLGIGAAAGGARTGNEPATYERRGSHSYFRDLMHRMVDPESAERIARNQREMEQRAGTTANFAGLTPPQYLLDLFAPFLHNARVTSNLVRSVPLPAVGTSFNLGRGTTATAIGVQASENATLTTADYDDTLLTFNLSTLGGYADLSRQEIERGVGTDEIVMQDLAAVYGQVLNGQVVSGSGAAGQLKGILTASGTNAITYTDATPTLGELWPKLADAVGQINTNRLMPATAMVMHPRRWAWVTAQLDANGRPLVGIAGAGGDFPMLASGDAAGVMRAVGNIMGLPVFVDPSIPTNLGAGTNEDRIIVGRFDDVLLMEEPSDGVPIRVRYEEPGANSLTIRIVAYGYAAMTAERYPAALSVVAGTGLVTPVL